MKISKIKRNKKKVLQYCYNDTMPTEMLTAPDTCVRDKKCQQTCNIFFHSGLSSEQNNLKIFIIAYGAPLQKHCLSMM